MAVAVVAHHVRASPGGRGSESGILIQTHRLASAAHYTIKPLFLSVCEMAGNSIAGSSALTREIGLPGRIGKPYNTYVL